MRSLIPMSLVVLTVASLCLTTVPEAACAQIPDTDIWLADLAAGDSILVTRPRNVTHRRGYDNQPCFLPGGGFLFSAADSGGQTDVFRFDPDGDRVARITSTPESEYSPTPLEAPERGFCAVRVEADSTQRLWRFDADGGHPEPVMSRVDSVGYFAWIDASRLAVFVVGDEPHGHPHTLRIVEVATQRETVVARDIGRAILRVPGTRDVSFPAREPDATYRFFVLKDGGGAPAPLIDGIGEGQDAAWMGDTLFMASGSTLYAATPGRSGGWRKVADFSAQGITTITRLAVAPDHTRLAFVSLSEGP